MVPIDNLDVGEMMGAIASTAPSKLQILHLTSIELSLHRLHKVGIACQNLRSLRCNVRLGKPADMPNYFNSEFREEVRANESLRDLSIGAESLVYCDDDHRKLRRVAQHLEILFPNLAVIDTGKEMGAAAKGKELYQRVKICQMTRSYHKLSVVSS